MAVNVPLPSGFNSVDSLPKLKENLILELRNKLPGVEFEIKAEPPYAYTY